MATNVRDLLPRHIKSYLWISFLFVIFMLMALSENGIFSRDASLDMQHAERDNQHSLEAESQITPSNTSSPTSESTPSDHKNILDPEDVVILVKTGATSLWRRMPAHMSTSLSNSTLTPNILFYSDSPDNINGHPIIDVLANISTSLKSSPDFVLYNRAREIASDNLYLESGSMEGDSYLPGGWRLDKYKFVPLFQHVANWMPGKKWYVYMEDDNYYFWSQLYAWLATMDYTKPLMIGSPAFRLGEDFAHGGSGFAISGRALEISFGADRMLASKYEEYAKEQCCGDQVLSHVLHEKGVQRYKKLDGSGWAALQSLPTWRIGFGEWNWCSPIMNIHKVHQKDISRLWVFEQEFMARTNGQGRLRYRDIFAGFAKENINAAQKSEWDNYATAKSFASSSDEEVNKGQTLTKAEIEKKPWFSKEACKEACVEWEQCLSWNYADDNCKIDHTAAMGQRIEAGIRMESGWMLERIARLEQVKCEDVKL